VAGPSHEFLEHTGEVHLRAIAPDLAGVLAEAGRALAELELGQPSLPLPEGDWKAVEVHAPDRAALVVDWLNELLYLAEVERWVPVAFEVVRADDRLVRARVGGVPVERSPALVKAATLHGVRVEPVAGGMEADVILDI
jgi:SHS2 domain-containing protein